VIIVPLQQASIISSPQLPPPSIKYERIGEKFAVSLAADDSIDNGYKSLHERKERANHNYKNCLSHSESALSPIVDVNFLHSRCTFMDN
jgi:hypothetical protein